MWRMPFAKSMRLYPTNPLQTATRPAFCSAALGPLKYSSTTAPTGLMDERISRETTFSNGGVPFSSNCLSVNTMLILIVAGVDVEEGVAVFVGVGVRDVVADAVTVGVDVRDGVALAVGVLLGVDVDVRDGVTVGVNVGVDVGFFVGVEVAVGVLLGV